MNSSSCLLFLGSNADSDEVIQRALHSLAALGKVTQFDVEHLPPRSGSGAWYFNALAIVEHKKSAQDLRQSLRAIEQALGRNRQTPEVVAIDIDVLAFRHGNDWLADAHALEKGELETYPVQGMLSKAGITIHCESTGESPV